MRKNANLPNQKKKSNQHKQATTQQPKNNNTEGKRKLSFNEKREYEQLTKDIESLEKEKAELETALASGTLSNDELVQKSQRFQEVTDLLDEKELRWLELDELN